MECKKIYINIYKSNFFFYNTQDMFSKVWKGGLKTTAIMRTQNIEIYISNGF